LSEDTTTDSGSDVKALPGDGLREGIIDLLRTALGEGLVDTHLVPNDDLWVRVDRSVWRRTAEVLRAAGFDYFCYISAIDWLPSPWGRGEEDPADPPPQRSTEIVQGVAGGDTRFQLLARLTDLSRHVGVTIKADVPSEDLVVDSWISVFAGANWHERETHEMFGIGFAGHPDLRNMYLPGDFEGYPLRKDFPLLARMVKPWPGIVDVEPMPVPDEPAEAQADQGAATE
jgi:NADH-quinone oxidoreductase subunit C